MLVNNKYLIPLLVISIVVVLAMVILRPTLAKTLEMRNDNNKNKVLLSKLTDKLDKLKAIDNVEVDRRVKLVEEIFPSKKPVMNLLGSLEALSLEEEVIFNGLELEPGKIDVGKANKDKKEGFDISFRIGGNLANISSFITKLEKTTPIMKIDRIDLKFASGDELVEDLKMEVKLAVKVYYQPLPETIGAIDQPLPIFNEEESQIVNNLSSYRIFPKIQFNSPTGKDNLFNLPGESE